MHGSKLNPEATIQYSKAFSSIILDDFFSKNEGINGQQIITVTPIKQVNFFVLKVLFEQWQEETKKFKSPFFNYRNVEVNGALKNLVNTLSKNILIEKEDFRPLLETAVSETLTLLFDPKSYYLAEAEKPSKNNDFRSISKYVKVYKSLFDKIALETEKQSETALNLVVSAVIQTATIDTAEQQSIIDEFDSILTLDIVENVVAPTPEKEETSFPEISASEAFSDAPSDSLNGHKSVLDEDLKQAFEPVNESDQYEAEEAGSINEKFGDQDIQTLNQKYESKEGSKTVASQLEEQETPGLSASININQRYMFLSDLFDGSEADYAKALETIDASNSFDDSVEFLVQNYSKKYSWDMNSDEVKEFLKVIFKRFR